MLKYKIEGTLTEKGTKTVQSEGQTEIKGECKVSEIIGFAHVLGKVYEPVIEMLDEEDLATFARMLLKPIELRVKK